VVFHGLRSCVRDDSIKLFEHIAQHNVSPRISPEPAPTMASAAEADAGILPTAENLPVCASDAVYEFSRQANNTDSHSQHHMSQRE
jgi:hypothetical protein